MVFINAQPDEYYFFWQLEILIFNFQTQGINLNNVHILIGYQKDPGLSVDFKEFKKKYPKANIFVYEDTRQSKRYKSSLRPHIIAKHFEQYGDLVNDVIFYHDSDIVFLKLPNFNILSQGETWYASATRGYIGAQSIIGAGGINLFANMCKIVGIHPEMVLANNDHAGGAQYVIKNVNAKFWYKLETDCEKVYSLLETAESTFHLNDGPSNVPFVEKWFTDMWVLWWNALAKNIKFEVHEELEFCWATSPVEQLYKVNILHYTGDTGHLNSPFFKKEQYVLYPPFNEDLTWVSNKYCGNALVGIIQNFNEERLRERYDLSDVSFLIPIRVDSSDRLTNLHIIVKYLHKNFKTNIIVMEVDEEQKVDSKELPDSIQYIFQQNSSSRLFRTKINNEMIKMVSSPFVSLYDTDVIVPVKQIIKSVRILRRGLYKIVSPYSGMFVNVDYLLKEIFMKMLDDRFLLENQYKGALTTKRSYGGCIFLHKKCYVESGMENENLSSWGPDDIERVKRMQILGYPTGRVPGPLFHLTHERKIDSGYTSEKELEDLMLTYLDISSKTRDELSKHIDSWEWKK